MANAGVAIDPVCGRPVVEATAQGLEYKKRRYFFCSVRCRREFERRAEQIHLRELARLGALFGDRKVRWGVA
jgi:YHS domain-containing protein